jgi:hypothetical protein
MTVIDVGTDPQRWSAFGRDAAKVLNDFGDRRQLWPINAFRGGAKGYLVPPLDGIWARAPYLHNGSVPNISELLEAPERRVKKFYRGAMTYDQKNMGWVSDQPEENGRKLFEYRTVADVEAEKSEPIPGNSNSGHVTNVPEPERKYLIEYLKTL